MSAKNTILFFMIEPFILDGLLFFDQLPTNLYVVARSD